MAWPERAQLWICSKCCRKIHRPGGLSNHHIYFCRSKGWEDQDHDVGQFGFGENLFLVVSSRGRARKLYYITIFLQRYQAYVGSTIMTLLSPRYPQRPILRPPLWRLGLHLWMGHKCWVCNNLVGDRLILWNVRGVRYCEGKRAIPETGHYSP